jgi:hypothetical protein
VIKPARTARDRKLARNASRKNQNTKNSSPDSNAIARANCNRSGSPTGAKATSVAARSAVMGASGLVTSWRELVKMANKTSGIIPA